MSEPLSKRAYLANTKHSVASPIIQLYLVPCVLLQLSQNLLYQIGNNTLHQQTVAPPFVTILLQTILPSHIPNLAAAAAAKKQKIKK